MHQFWSPKLFMVNRAVRPFNPIRPVFIWFFSSFIQEGFTIQYNDTSSHQRTGKIFHFEILNSQFQSLNCDFWGFFNIYTRWIFRLLCTQLCSMSVKKTFKFLCALPYYLTSPLWNYVIKKSVIFSMTNWTNMWFFFGKKKNVS